MSTGPETNTNQDILNDVVADKQISQAEIEEIEKSKVELNESQERHINISNTAELEKIKQDSIQIINSIQNIDNTIGNNTELIQAIQAILSIQTIMDSSYNKANIRIDGDVNSLKSLFVGNDNKLDKLYIAIPKLQNDIRNEKMINCLLQICGSSRERYDEYCARQKEELKGKAISAGIERGKTVSGNLNNDNILRARSIIAKDLTTDLIDWRNSYNAMKGKLGTDGFKAAKILMAQYLSSQGQELPNKFVEDINNSSEWNEESDIIKSFQNYIIENGTATQIDLIKKSGGADGKIGRNTFTVLQELNIIPTDVEVGEVEGHVDLNGNEQGEKETEIPDFNQENGKDITVASFIEALGSREGGKLQINKDKIQQDGEIQYIKIGEKRYAIDVNQIPDLDNKTISILNSGQIRHEERYGDQPIIKYEKFIQIGKLVNGKFEGIEYREMDGKNTRMQSHEIEQRTIGEGEDSQVLNGRFVVKQKMKEEGKWGGPSVRFLEKKSDGSEEDAKRLSKEQQEALFGEPNSDMLWILNETITSYGPLEEGGEYQHKPLEVGRYNLNRMISRLLGNQDIQKELNAKNDSLPDDQKMWKVNNFESNPFADNIGAKESVKRFLGLKYGLNSNPNHKLNVDDMTQEEGKAYKNKNEGYERPLQGERLITRLKILQEVLSNYLKTKKEASK